MGRAEKVLQESSLVRNLFYGDGYICNKITDCKFQQYILDNKDNEAVLDRAITEPGIKLVIAPTGAGKSVSILNRAKEIVQKSKDCRVVIALPTVALAEQLGKNSGVYKMVGGDAFDENARLIVTTYEKMFEIKDFIEMQKRKQNQDKTYLILDESHLFTTQHLFRYDAISNVIDGIEHNIYDSLALISATPEPMSLFHCHEIIEFQSENKPHAIKKIEVVEADDVLEYLKNMDYANDFPFIRLNSKGKIQELMDKVPGIVKITADDKKTKTYHDIVEHSRIDANGVTGIVVTSLLEAGVSVTDYPDNIVPIAAFPDNNLSIDDMEQFLNRIRYNGKQIDCAKIVIRKPKVTETETGELKADGTVVPKYKDLFSFIETNYKRCTNFQNTVEPYANAMEQKRMELKAQGLDNAAMELLGISDNTLIEKMVQGSINTMGRIKDCLSYRNGAIVLDKRILYMISYEQFQEQHYYHHEMLKKELEERLHIPVEMIHADTEKGSYTYNVTDIWENMENIRTIIKDNCSHDFWEALMGKGGNFMYIESWRNNVNIVRGQKHIMELLQNMERAGITGTIALKILINSTSKAKITKYMNMHQVILWNRLLADSKKTKIEDIQLFTKSPNEKMQVAVYCYLKQKEQKTLKLKDELLKEVIAFYKESYPLAVKIPSTRKIKSLILKMYKTKSKDTIFTDLRVDVTDIFQLVASDY